MIGPIINGTMDTHIYAIEGGKNRSRIRKHGLRKVWWQICDPRLISRPAVDQFESCTAYRREMNRKRSESGRHNDLDYLPIQPMFTDGLSKAAQLAACGHVSRHVTGRQPRLLDLSESSFRLFEAVAQQCIHTRNGCWLRSQKCGIVTNGRMPRVQLCKQSRTEDKGPKKN